MSAIVVNELTKRLGKKVIFSDINLEVLEGEFYAVLGLEGQGKTTLAKIIFNYLNPTTGSINVFDMDCTKDSRLIKESVSYVPEEFIFQDNVRAISLFKKTLAFHNLKNTEELNYLVEYFGFNQKVRVIDMTENEKKLFSIINALIVKPRLLILDEPTKYLSIEDTVKLFDHLNKLKSEENLTMFMLTDSLVDAQRYCDRGAFLHDGQIKNTEYLKDKAANDKIIKIYSELDSLDRFTDIGAKVIKESVEEKILYFDGNLNLLSQVIASLNIVNYNIEDSSLSDKISAYYKNVEEVEG